MRNNRKKTDLTVVIRDEEIKIRKAAVRPGQKHRDKTKYSRQENKRFLEQIPDRSGRGFFRDETQRRATMARLCRMSYHA